MEVSVAVIAPAGSFEAVGITRVIHKTMDLYDPYATPEVTPRKGGIHDVEASPRP